MLLRVLSLLLGVIGFLAAAVMFSVLFLIGAAAALALGGWFWWNTRHLRRQASAAPRPGPGGHVIEGEYRVEERPEIPAAPNDPESPRNGDRGG